MAGGGQELSNACGAGRYPWAVWIVSVNLHSCRKALAILTIQIDLDGWCALTTLNRPLVMLQLYDSSPRALPPTAFALNFHWLP